MKPGKPRTIEPPPDPHLRSGRRTVASDVFSGLDEADRAALLARMSRRHYEPGETIFTQGTRHVLTYFIEAGLVHTYYASPLGREITLGYWSQHDIIGGPDFFDEECLHIWSAKVVEPAITLSIRGRDLRELTERIPRLATHVNKVLTFKLRWVSVLLQMIGTESVHQRIAHLLLQLSQLYGEPDPEGVRIPYVFSQEQLANMVGATRPWVNTLMGDLQRQGVIRIENRHIVVTDPVLLHTLATDPPESAEAPGARRGRGGSARRAPEDDVSGR